MGLINNFKSKIGLYDEELEKRLKLCEKETEEALKDFEPDETDSRPYFEQKRDFLNETFDKSLQRHIGLKSDYDISQFSSYKNSESINFLQRAGWSLEQIAEYQESKEGKKILGNKYFEQMLDVNGRYGTQSLNEELFEKIEEFEKVNHIKSYEMVRDYEDFKETVTPYLATNGSRMGLKDVTANCVKDTLSERIGPKSGFKLESFEDWNNEEKLRALIMSGWTTKDFMNQTSDLKNVKKIQALEDAKDSGINIYQKKEFEQIVESKKEKEGQLEEYCTGRYSYYKNPDEEYYDGC